VGAQATPEDADLPGRSLWPLAADPDPQRTVLSEYHALHSRSGVTMLRSGPYKYVHYVGEPPQLFDLAADPNELHDLAPDPTHRRLLQQLEAQLRTLLDPEATDRRAKAEQAAKVAAHGGRDALIRRGTFDNSPVPGERLAFRRVE
jgi:choline-sulfatase